jgi:hypothetical protein
LRGREGISLAVNGSRQIHATILTTAATNAKPQEKHDFAQQRFRNPFVNGNPIIRK